MRQVKCLAVLLLGLALSYGAWGQTPPCPNFPPVTLNSPNVPTDVCIPPNLAGNTPIDQLPYFDDYSWRVFLAMVWPASAGQRGVPDTARKPDGGGPVVFQTLKALWEVLHPENPQNPNDLTPAPWNVYDQSKFNACGVAPHFGDLVLSSFSKFSDMGQTGFGSLVCNGATVSPGKTTSLCGPLVAQNRTYIHYATAYNRIEFEQILAQKLYQLENLVNITFDNGSLDVKAAWMDMQGVAHPERYYTTFASVQSGANGACSGRMVGLVGLHIVQKTPSRPHWIWSTFEHIDNVPPAPLGGLKPYAFYTDGAGNMPTSNPFPINPLAWPPPAPFNVQRTTPIQSSTQSTNLAYRAALQQIGSVWQNYQLVMTQFPTLPDGTGRTTFPAVTDGSAIANTTMETFLQDGKTAVTCIGCHNIATDFVWSLGDRRRDKGIGLDPVGQPALDQLRKMLGGATAASKQK